MRHHWHRDINHIGNQISFRAPSTVTISTDHDLMAIVYRGTLLCLWDLEGHRHVGFCTKILDDGSSIANHIVSVCFNPVRDLNMLVVSYMDGYVAVFDTVSLAIKWLAKIDTQIIAVSPDGRTLAGGDSVGNLKIFDFERLQLLYRVTLSSDGISALGFTGNSFRPVDIRSAVVNVWEPSVLVRKSNDADEDGTEISSDVATLFDSGPADMIPHYYNQDIVRIKAAFGESMAICGRLNGAVDMYDPHSGKLGFQTLYEHTGSTPVLLLDWTEKHRIVVSVDSSSRIKAMRLFLSPKNIIYAVEELLDSELPSRHVANQILISPDGTKLLASSTATDFLWSFESKSLIASRHIESLANWAWVTHPLLCSQLIYFEVGKLQFHSWDASGFSQVGEAQVDTTYVMNLGVENVELGTTDTAILIKIISQGPRNTSSSTPARNLKETSLYSLEISTSPNVQSKILQPVPFFHSEDHKMIPTPRAILGNILGASDQTALVFLSTTGWICSVPLDNRAPHTLFQRHFFVPSAWLSTSSPIMSLRKRMFCLFGATKWQLLGMA
ncbi:hypothetical protein AJ79_00556 [Helicocarpus griseus UAMH5409]|uniref:Anaphase-promoting complex subunit 4 WD40 domain-containing protein n=1 Tax=Helicocarpus griseus UAMH5409 TaxID=1447875 RepID=A0A2B7YBC6_9EURO|nr:hypothetical protein AJ79_00556 [Helicocarpus griseus UAMH5409]